MGAKPTLKGQKSTLVSHLMIFIHISLLSPSLRTLALPDMLLCSPRTAPCHLAAYCHPPPLLVIPSLHRHPSPRTDAVAGVPPVLLMHPSPCPTTGSHPAPPLPVAAPPCKRTPSSSRLLLLALPPTPRPPSPGRRAWWLHASPPCYPDGASTTSYPIYSLVISSTAGG